MVASHPNEQDLRELIAEHEQLRKEILHNQTTAMQIMTATLFLVAAVTGFAFSPAVQNFAVKSIMFFVVECAAIIGMLQAVETGWVTFLIASYLRVFTEAELRHLKWETRLMKFRKRHSELNHGGFIGNQLWIYTFIVIANFILGCWYALQSSQDSTMVVIISLLALWFVATLLLIWAAWSRNSKFINKFGETFETIWKEIREDEANPKELKQQVVELRTHLGENHHESAAHHPQ